jgi:hypothetical protein
LCIWNKLVVYPPIHTHTHTQTHTHTHRHTQTHTYTHTHTHTHTHTFFLQMLFLLFIDGVAMCIISRLVGYMWHISASLNKQHTVGEAVFCSVDCIIGAWNMANWEHETYNYSHENVSCCLFQEICYKRKHFLWFYGRYNSWGTFQVLID